MIERDFDRWNELKKILHSKPEKITFNEGEIWWCSLGLNLGSEQDGKNELFERPVLILRKFNESIALIAPLTSVLKRNRYHYILGTEAVILSQLRLVSVKRFQRFVKIIPDTDVVRIKERHIDLIRQP